MRRIEGEERNLVPESQFFQDVETSYPAPHVERDQTARLDPQNLHLRTRYQQIPWYSPA